MGVSRWAEARTEWRYLRATASQILLISSHNLIQFNKIQDHEEDNEQVSRGMIQCDVYMCNCVQTTWDTNVHLSVLLSALMT